MLDKLASVPRPIQLEPDVATKTRGRPSTKRISSKFEVVEKEIKAMERVAKRKLKAKDKGKGKGKSVKRVRVSKN